MECKRDETLRERDTSEKKFAMHNFEGAREFVVKAQQLHPCHLYRASPKGLLSGGCSNGSSREIEDDQLHQLVQRNSGGCSSSSGCVPVDEGGVWRSVGEPKMYLHNADNAGASAGVSLTMVEESYGWAQRQKVLRLAEKDRVNVESKKLKKKKIRSKGAKKQKLLTLCLPVLKKRKETIRKALTVRRKKRLKRRKQDDDDLKQPKLRVMLAE